MRSGTLLGAALIALTVACASSAVGNRGAYTRVVVHNHQWEDATLDLYCGSQVRARIRVGAAASATRHLLLLPCTGGMWVQVGFLANRRADGSRHTRVSTAEHGLDRSGYVDITIPHKIDAVFLAIYTERAR
jgi:hypothetical protein